MLTRLDIRHVVLIDALALEWRKGLSALTGETGAGKSILLDALALALGGRADAALVRHGQEQASVAAAFDVPPAHPARTLLKDKDIDADGDILLRRTLGADGRSKAFVNDIPVSIQTLREVGACLVEIHGQFESRSLLDPDTHGGLLDAFGGLENRAAAVEAAWKKWRAAEKSLETAQEQADTARAQHDYLTHTVAELEKLGAAVGEEARLAERRSLLLNHEKLRRGLAEAQEALEGEDGIDTRLGRVSSSLQRLSGSVGGALGPVLEALARAESEIAEALQQIEKVHDAGNEDGGLEKVEERYFALKECAKKHRCAPDDLPALHDDLAARLRQITDGGNAIPELQKAVAAAKAEYASLATQLSRARAAAAKKLSAAVNAELPDLKLEKAVFSAVCAMAQDEAGWGPRGMDTVHFAASTNPGAPAAPLHKIASGGELARFTLALKVVLAATGAVPTLVFDEVDSGIGGATAAAVGERLAQLSKTYQVLVVTHSPQVAARAAHHWTVSKSADKNQSVTHLTALTKTSERQEEIARMISGQKITAEARAAAVKLLEGGKAA